MVRGLLNHLGPWIGGAGIVQENGTAQMSQIALGYRDSPLSANHVHGGDLHAGDRVPDLPVRVPYALVGWDDRLFGLLDPSRFVLLIVHPTDSEPMPVGVRDAVRDWDDLIGVVELAPAADDPSRARFQSAFGRSGGAFLVRPDGYIGLTAGNHAAPRVLEEYCRRWLIAPGRSSDPTSDA